jgi:hypothetical protein
MKRGLFEVAAQLRTHIELNSRLCEELERFRSSVVERRKTSIPPPSRPSEPFRQRDGCQRCSALLALLVCKAGEMSQRALAGSLTVGNARLNGFREAVLEVRSLIQECRTIRQELEAHVASHCRPDLASAASRATAAAPLNDDSELWI